MKYVPAQKSIKFGFRTFWKKILFFLGAVLVSILGWLLGFFLSLLVSYPFFRQLVKYKDKFKEVFSQSFVALKGVGAQAVAAAEAGAADPNVAPVATGGRVAAGVLGSLKAVWNNFYNGITTLISQRPSIVFYVVLGVVLFFVFMVATNMYFYLGWTRVSLEFKDKGKSSISSLFSRISVLFKALISALIYAFIIFLPWKIAFLIAYLFHFNKTVTGILFFLAFIACVYLVLKFFFFPYFIVDRNAGPIEALKKSFKLEGAPLHLIILGLALGFIFIILSLPAVFAGRFRVEWLLVIAAIYRILLNFASFVVGKLSVASLYRDLSKPDALLKTEGESRRDTGTVRREL